MSDELTMQPRSQPSEPSTPAPNKTGGPALISHQTRSSNRPRMPSLAGREVHTLAEAAAAKASPLPTQDSFGSSERATRSKTKPPAKVATKLKLKLGEKASQGIMTSFLGTYDRDLDSDDEDLHFEEQFILRMPEGEDCEKLRAMVSKREVSNDVWFKFKDSRRGTFHIGNNTYRSRLVDLPCIIESQKTLDNKQMFKIADICQMLVIEDKVERESELPEHTAAFNINDFIWPHGVSLPLKHVRKRRFRKRMSRATIEIVEQEVERLLEEDSRATKVEYEILENVNPDLSDNEFDIDNKFANSPDPEQVGQGFGFDQAPTPEAASHLGGDDIEMEDEEAEGAGDESDDDLAAELERAMNGEAEGDDSGDEDDEEDDDDDESEEDGEDGEDRELAQARRLLSEEIADLEAAVNKKIGEISSSGNPLIKRRFEDALKKLQADLDTKVLQREQLMVKPQDETNEMDVEGEQGDDGFDDLFDGDDEEEEEEEVPAEAPAPTEVAQGDEEPAEEVADSSAPQTVPSGPVTIELN